MTDPANIERLPARRTRRVVTTRARPTRRLDSAVRALRAAGERIDRIEIDSSGKIAIFCASGAEDSSGNDLDKELVRWEAQHGQG
jgi:hypothetical protein